MSSEPELSEEEIEQKKQELQEEVSEISKEHKESEQALIEAVSQDEEIGQYDVVELGDIEMKIQLWIPGDELEDMNAGMSEEEITQVFSDVDRFVSLIVKLVEELRYPAEEEYYTDDLKIKHFVISFVDTYGTDAMVRLAETVVLPVVEHMEEKSQGLQSFQGQR